MTREAAIGMWVSFVLTRSHDVHHMWKRDRGATLFKPLGPNGDQGPGLIWVHIYMDDKNPTACTSLVSHGLTRTSFSSIFFPTILLSWMTKDKLEVESARTRKPSSYLTG